MNIMNVKTYVRAAGTMLVALLAFACVYTVGCENGGSDGDGGGKAVITQEEYDAIQRGMSYDYVVAIIGSPGTPEEGSNPDLGWYSWKNANGSSVTIAFNNGVWSKYADGDLPSATTSSGGGGPDGSNSQYVITQKEYDEIQIGMTYKQVVSIIGQGGLLYDTQYDTRTFEWMDIFPDFSTATAYVTFTTTHGNSDDEVVVSKSNTGNLP